MEGPKYLRSDNGPEFMSRAVLKWPTEANIDTAHIDPGKPWQNGSAESFNGKFRDECLTRSGSRIALIRRSRASGMRRQLVGIAIEFVPRNPQQLSPHSGSLLMPGTPRAQGPEAADLPQIREQ